ncbi:MAG: MerR family transcriptional regulator [Fusobacteriaceae bacterium]|nr:MerR family transcriptional regulator [Fusobacteriaceae bacterium]MBN2838253.1 MerR family transcriptional regulator [Fusobacteriaceae bacterium]
MKTYTIKEVSELFNIPNSTIRYYEEIGILTKVERTSVGKRIFLESHINRLKAISCFKNTGMSLEKIKQFFDFEDDEYNKIDDIISLLSNQEKKVIEDLERLKKDYNHIKKKILYYTDVKKSVINKQILPQWKDYK